MKVTKVDVTEGGSGYTGAPSIAFAGGGASKEAKGTVKVDKGKVTKVDITDGGDGYTSEPQVQVMGGGGAGATFKVTLG